MWTWLEQLVRRVKMSSIAPDTNDAPRDPYSYVRHPLVHRPGGRDAAIALEEPDEEKPLILLGHSVERRSAPRAGG
jgi:hypothetical protein